VLGVCWSCLSRASFQIDCTSVVEINLRQPILFLRYDRPSYIISPIINTRQSWVGNPLQTSDDYAEPGGRHIRDPVETSYAACHCIVCRQRGSKRCTQKKARPRRRRRQLGKLRRNPLPVIRGGVSFARHRRRRVLSQCWNPFLCVNNKG